MMMLTRGPRHRKKSLERVPKAMAETNAEIEAEIRQWIADEPNDPMAHQRLKEFELARTKFSAEIPQSIADQIRRPFWSERTVECIHNMFWHLLPAPQGTYFVTCDTPAHLFDCYGVGTLKSEYTITLAKGFALIGEHNRNWGIKYERPYTQIAKEVNRRIISHAERFVFSPRKDIWIATVAQKTAPYLSRIDWA
jgi:hypothetical protein